jgi:hypothetical protein
MEYSFTAGILFVKIVWKYLLSMGNAVDKHRQRSFKTLSRRKNDD